MTDDRREPVQACIGIGSNLNNPRQQVIDAIERLDELQSGHILRHSSLYQSAPFGPVSQDDFVNAVAIIETVETPEGLLACLKEIERNAGRDPQAERWGPRVIDLDILLYGSETVDQPGLTIPHPCIAARNFVLLPLREIAPDLVVPGLGPVAGIAIDEQLPAIRRID
jgi:2-amino-4-hydroxy-6-hydroxymethyldihydropteridine diphosphokinase